MQKYNKNRKQNKKDQLTIRSFVKLHSESLQDNVVDKSETETLCNFLLKVWMKQKIFFFSNV